MIDASVANEYADVVSSFFLMRTKVTTCFNRLVHRLQHEALLRVHIDGFSWT